MEQPSETENLAASSLPFSFKPFPGEEALSEYLNCYRRIDLPPLEVGPPLDLYPSRPRSADFTPRLTWESQWPFGEQAGVYLLYDDAFELIYIGKSSMNRCLGKRLYEHFGDGDVCAPKWDWLHPVRYVINIAMPVELPFEAPALEEFLIRKLQPRANGSGK